MADERNFRSNYYDKVGFRTVEEKKSIELLLKDKPLDVDKLKQYCLRFSVSARYRIYLWKVILGVIPANQGSQDFVMKNRQEQYEHLRHALEVMRKIDRRTDEAEVFLKMYLIEEGLLPFKEDNLTSTYQSYVDIANGILQVAESDIEAYWITNNFYRMFHTVYKSTVPLLPEKVKSLLKKEDTDQKLWNHLAKHEVWQTLPLTNWFNSCFASVLPGSSFNRVIDKLVGGSIMILVYIAVALLSTLRRPLLTMNSREEMTKYLLQVPEDSGDIVVNKAIDMWEKHGHHMYKSDSPGPVNRSPT